MRGVVSKKCVADPRVLCFQSVFSSCRHSHPFHLWMDSLGRTPFQGQSGSLTCHVSQWGFSSYMFCGGIHGSASPQGLTWGSLPSPVSCSGFHHQVATVSTQFFPIVIPRYPPEIFGIYIDSISRYAYQFHGITTQFRGFQWFGRITALRLSGRVPSCVVAVSHGSVADFDICKCQSWSGWSAGAGWVDSWAFCSHCGFHRGFWCSHQWDFSGRQISTGACLPSLSLEALPVPSGTIRAEQLWEPISGSIKLGGFLVRNLCPETDSVCGVTVKNHDQVALSSWSSIAWEHP